MTMEVVDSRFNVEIDELNILIGNNISLYYIIEIIERIT